MSNIANVPEDVLVISLGNNRNPIVLSLQDTKEAEKKLPEIKNVDYSNYANLISLFTSACSELAKASGFLGLELSRVENEMSLLHSRLTLEVVPERLKLLGLKDTLANATAIINGDLDYALISKIKSDLEAVIMLLEKRYKSLSMAYFSVKDIGNMKFSQPSSKFNNDLTIPEGAFAGAVVRRSFKGEF